MEKPPKTHKNHTQMGMVLHGAGDVTRTRDLLITSEMLYQLSYTSL